MNAYLNRCRFSSHRIQAAGCSSHQVAAETLSKEQWGHAVYVVPTNTKEAYDERISSKALATLVTAGMAVFPQN